MPNPTLQPREALSLNPALARFSSKCLDNLAAAAELIRLQTGTVVFQPGGSADRLYLVVDGRVDLLVDDPSGNRTRVETLAPPRLAGLSCALSGNGYAYTAVVESASALLAALPADTFRRELAASPTVAKLLLAETSVRLRRLVSQVGDLKLRDSVQRLAGYLIELCAAELGAADVILPSEKRAVADRLGMKPETFSRAMARLEALGLAQGDQSARLRLPDLARLRHLYLSGEESSR